MKVLKQHINKLSCKPAIFNIIQTSVKYTDYLIKVSLGVFILNCLCLKSYAQKVEKTLDSLKVSTPYAIGQKGDNVYVYSAKYNDNQTLIDKFKIDRKEKSITKVDSLFIQNTFLRYIGADRENHLYLSLLPTTPKKQIIINHQKTSIGNRTEGLNILYELDASDFNIIDSINYVGNNLELASANNLHGLIFSTNRGIGIFNKLGYYPRVNQFNHKEMEEKDIKIEDNDFIYQIYFKSREYSRYFPIPKNIIEDLSNPNSKKKYKSLSHITPIFFLNEDQYNLYFTYNLEVSYPNSKDPLTIENHTKIPRIQKGERKFCQLFSLNKETGNLNKIFQFEYHQPIRVDKVGNTISFSPISNIQQLRVDEENLMFAISGIMNSEELGMSNNNTLFTSIVSIDKGNKKTKTRNIPYSKKQFVDIYKIENKGIPSTKRFKEYDNVENMGLVFNNDKVLLFHKRNSNHYLMVQFK